jgi:hypothetical protein
MRFSKHSASLRNGFWLISLSVTIRLVTVAGGLSVHRKPGCYEASADLPATVPGPHGFAVPFNNARLRAVNVHG